MGESRPATCSTHSRRAMKKPLMGSERLVPSSFLREARRGMAVGAARAAQPFALRAVDVAAADDEIGFVVRQTLQHARQERFVMLQIAVDHGDIRRARRENAFETGAGQTAATEAAQAAHARILGRDGFRHGRSPVRRVIVDDDRFPRNAVERTLEPRNELRDVLGFVEGRNDDRKNGRHGRREHGRAAHWETV